MNSSEMYKESGEAFLALINFLKKKTDIGPNLSKGDQKELRKLCAESVMADIECSNRYLESMGVPLANVGEILLKNEKIERLLAKCYVLLAQNN